MKIESEGVDDTDKTVQELVAQCHCNIALAKLGIATSDAFVEGVRSCNYAIHLMLKWGKSYYRRGLCYENQGLSKLAIKDFKAAKKLCPKDSVVGRALLCVQLSTKKK